MDGVVRLPIEQFGPTLADDIGEDLLTEFPLMILQREAALNSRIEDESYPSPKEHRAPFWPRRFHDSSAPICAL